MRFPATAPVSFLIFELRFPICDGTGRAPACADESPKLDERGAAPRRPAKSQIEHIYMGSWQTSNALALQASRCGSVTHRLHQPSLRAQRVEAAAAGALASARAIAPSCQAMLRALARQSHFRHPWLNSQSRPRCLQEVKGASPSGTAIFSECRAPVCNSERPAWDREVLAHLLPPWER